jgi:hypothetical protein
MSILTATLPTVKTTSTRHGLRAPRGGCTVNGQVFKGGCFCRPYDEANPHELPTVEAKPEPARTTINGFVYTVEPARIHPEVGSVAFRMHKIDTNNTYHVHRDIHGEVVCSCPDFEFKRAGTGSSCKHGRRLVELGMLRATAPRTTEPAPIAATPARRRWYRLTPEEMAEAAQMFADLACR